MAGFRRTRYLSCFYCGRRTSTRYDGRMRHFECPNCEATNYLDEDGDITDPPVATTTSAETRSPVFASQQESRQQSHSPSGVGSSSYGGGGSGESSNVFCATCLKNQHLFVSSLAQYFPPDPDHPEFPELERKYFRFRQGLEQRYPQVCSDCEPAVLERMRQAGYTAKTDHLRRMVNYSRQVRLTRPTYLDAANRLGRWLWHAGLLFQLLWQLGLLARFVPTGRADGQGFGDGEGFGDDEVVGPSDVQDALLDALPPPASLSLSPSLSLSLSLRFAVSLAPLALSVLSWTTANTARLQSLCVGTTVAGCWWNPYFVQTVRGFTKPFIGISTWYSYQATLVFVRVMFAALAARLDRLDRLDRPDRPDRLNTAEDSPRQLPPPTTLGLHAFTVLFTLYIYAKAPRSIRKDVRPLFSKLPDTPRTPPPRRPRTADERAENRRRGLETLSDVLDEITAASPTPTNGRHVIDSPPRQDAFGSGGWSSSWQSPPKTEAANDASLAWGRSRQVDGDGDGAVFGAVFGGASRQKKKKKSALELGSLRLSDEYASSHQPPSLSQERDAYYAEEMDWTPSQPSEPLQSPYRAFSSYGGSSPMRAEPSSSSFSSGAGADAGAAFGQTPVKVGHGPFWYKVPPAPTSIAKRVLNPPNMPRLGGVTSATGVIGAAATPSAFFGRRDGENARWPRLDLGAGGSQGSAAAATAAAAAAAASSSSVEFAQPRFFASNVVGGGEAGNSLSDLFSQSFTLGAGDGVDALNGGRATEGGGGGGASAQSGPWPLWMSMAWSSVLVCSLAILHDLHTEDQRLWVSAAVDGLLIARLLPYAKVVETAAVGLCTVTAATLTGESIRCCRRAVVAGQQQQQQQGEKTEGAVTRMPRLWPHVFGCMLGLAATGLAGQMAVQLGAVLSSGVQPKMAVRGDADAENAVLVAAAASAALSLPWQWWQLVGLHSLAVVHQVWNAMVV